MIARCYQPSVAQFKDYGGRGIAVCDRWRTFENFLADMGERPAGKSIDRFPNGNGNYEPGNCRWATRREQYATRSTTRLTDGLAREIHGRREHGESAVSIARRMGVSDVQIRRVLGGKQWRHIFKEGLANGTPG